MSRKRKIWAVVSLAVALVVLIPLGLRWQAQWHLNAYRKKLIASGEKLTVEELAPKSNWQATNTALFLRLASALPPFGDLSPEAMLSIKPGVARVAWRQTRCMEKMDDKKPAIDVWPVIMDAVRTNQATLDELQALLDAGGIELMEDYSQPTAFNGFTYLPTVKILAIAFSARAMLALHRGQMREAFEYLKSCGTVSQLTAKDPLMIDQLVSYSCMTIAAGGCWEALQAGGWTDDQLAQLQHQWDQSDILAAAESSLVMERARGPMLFQVGRTSRQGLNYMLGRGSGLRGNAEIWQDFLLNAGTGVRELLASYPRYWGWKWIWSYRDEQRYLEFMQTMIDTVRDAQKRQPALHLPAIRVNVNTLEEPEETANWDVVESMKDGMKRFVLKAFRAQTEQGIVRTAIALERFRLARHACPTSLRDLVPDFLRQVPVDCMDGHDLRYRLNPDSTYLLYSVGEDGIDDGGNGSPKEGSSARFWLYGRDWVWPRPATDEEVQAYEAEQNKPKARFKRR
jgi:hypothetical protein